MKIKDHVRARVLLPALALMCCLWAGQARAQSVPVTFRASDVSLEQVLQTIEKQTSYLFVYDKNVDVQRKVSVEAAATPLNDVLKTLFNGSNVAYAVNGSSIVLSSAKDAVVTGKVVDADGAPLVGAAVMVKGTTVGVSTGTDGAFTLQVPAPVSSAVLKVSNLGYDPVEVTVGSRTQLLITLKQSSVGMDAVVVTALGIKRSEKALSYNVQQVNADEIIGNKDANFINSLNGKVAGVTFNASSSGVGSASKVVMRGPKSIIQSSNVLYVIDGIPMNNTQPSTTGGVEFDSSGGSESIADINPEDIESMTVLNGASAAALYGSSAANGVISITTKKGQAGALRVTVSSNTEINSPFVLPRFQSRYGMGSSEGNNTYSWGAKLNQANYRGYDPRSDYFQTGVVGTENVSISTGNERNQTYASAGAVDSRGMIPNNDYDRYNFTFRNTSNFFDGKMTLDVGAQYILEKDRNMTSQGTYYNSLTGAYLFPRGNDWNDIKMYERYDVSRNIYTQYWPVGDAGITMQNPYWIDYRNLRENDKQRYALNASLSYQILDWLNVTGRVRVDNSYNDYTQKYYASTVQQLAGNSNNGYYGLTRSTNKQTYADVMVNINKTFGDDWSLQANVGGSINNTRYDDIANMGAIADGAAVGDQPGITNYFTVANLNQSTLAHYQTGWREQMQSVFASAEVGFKNAYYLTVTGRNDWPSQLWGHRSTKSSFFYPSVGGSVILSQIIPNMPEDLSYIKLRGSYADVGLAFPRYVANPEHPMMTATGGGYSNQTDYPLIDLKPERTSSWEIGLTMRFLRHFNLDFSYYNSKTKDQTLNPQISTSSGYSTIYIQSGAVRNRGVELSLGYSNTWGKFSWDSNYTLSSNQNKILSLADNVTNPVTGEKFSVSQLNMGGLGDARFIYREGGSLGDMYSLTDLRRDSNGQIYVDADGNLATQTITDSKDYIKLGSVLPKANMAWRNDFKIGNFNFGFMLSARFGGIVFSRTQAMMDDYGVSAASADARDRGYVTINGSDHIAPEKWFSTIGGGNSIAQYYTYSATNIRLQEASIGYTIPRTKLGGVCEITLSLVGRNLWMIYNKAPFDPEGISSMNNYYQGIDYFMTPTMRTFGFNVRVKF